MFHSMGRYDNNGLLNFGNFQYGGIFMLILGVILIALILYVIFRKDTESDKSKTDSPLDLLKKRYVNDEISEEEFLKKKEMLKK